jgi:dTDP-4-amino-4,6-dideoxygalactose transaminase
VHLQEPYRALALGPVRLSVAERLCEHVLSIPLYPELTDAEVESVVAALAAFEG